MSTDVGAVQLQVMNVYQRGGSPFRHCRQVRQGVIAEIFEALVRRSFTCVKLLTPYRRWGANQ